MHLVMPYLSHLVNLIYFIMNVLIYAIGVSKEYVKKPDISTEKRIG